MKRTDLMTKTIYLTPRHLKMGPAHKFKKGFLEPFDVKVCHFIDSTFKEIRGKIEEGYKVVFLDEGRKYLIIYNK